MGRRHGVALAPQAGTFVGMYSGAMAGTACKDCTAANFDPDGRPFTPEELAKARRVPRVRTLRRALGPTQEEFAARYRIPLGTLRDWEQARSEPDRAYLTVIAHNPEGVRKALTSSGTS